MPAVRNTFVPISIHALREEGDHHVVFVGERNFISIHALREEGDYAAGYDWEGLYISIHALREEGDARFVVTDGALY